MSDLTVGVRVLKALPLVANKPICLFISNDPSGRTKPHVQYHLARLRASGYLCVLILSVDVFQNKSFKLQMEAVDGLILRRRIGLDFAAWGDAFKAMPNLWSADHIIMVNDTIVGPLIPISPFLSELKSRDADIVFATESSLPQLHYQTDFILLKKQVLHASGMRNLWAANSSTSKQVTKNSERKFGEFCKSIGLRCAAVYPHHHFRLNNFDPMIAGYRSLLEAGWPYIKVDLLTGILDVISRQQLIDMVEDWETKQLLTSL